MTTVHSVCGAYEVRVETGIAHRIGALLPDYERFIVVSDSGVPQAIKNEVCEALPNHLLFVFAQGETHKSFSTLQDLLVFLSDNRVTRRDCLVALGGGVVSDLTGLAASLYWRGMDYVNLPTTLLAAVDAGIGGKTAVNLCGYKNQIGRIYPPRAVYTDVSFFHTLPPEQIRNGMAEVIKMAVTLDAGFFADLENTDNQPDWKTIVERCVKLKAAVVQADENEQGLRRVLNFGHTVGHALESVCTEFRHGECVALGMLCCCAPDLKERLIRLYRFWNLPVDLPVSRDVLIQALRHDKKGDGKTVMIVYADAPGRYRFLSKEPEDFA